MRYSPGGFSSYAEQRRVYGEIMRGLPLKPADRQVAEVVVNRWIWRSWRLVLLCAWVLSSSDLLYFGIVRVSHGASGGRAVWATLPWLLGLVGSLVVIRQQVRLRRWQRKFLAPRVDR
jgi:membrane protein YdbS with pleckstrin-like domain